jgi:hypothetical protein
VRGVVDYKDFVMVVIHFFYCGTSTGVPFLYNHTECGNYACNMMAFVWTVRFIEPWLSLSLSLSHCFLFVIVCVSLLSFRLTPLLSLQSFSRLR